MLVSRIALHRVVLLGVVLQACLAATAGAAPPKLAAAAAKPRPAVKQPDNEHTWKSQIKRVAVFKNGLGFFMREGDVVTRDGWALAREVPPATFGTLAIYSLRKDELVDVVGSGPGEIVEFDGVDAPDTGEARRSRLEALRNLNVQLVYRHKESDRTAAGKLLSVGTEYAVLEANDNSFAVPIEQITRLEVLELPLRVHVASEAAKPDPATSLGMAYLRQGITWIPEYSLEVLDDTTAQLTLRGTLVNEAEDLVHCDVNFVVGVPHFLHTDHLAPVAVGQVLRTIGVAVAPPQLQSQIMNRAAIANNTQVADQFGPGVIEQPVVAGGGNIGQALGNLPQLEGPGAADYTVYTKQDLTVRRGEKAIVTLFVRKIKYSHIYRWSPPAIMEHSLVLRNDTDSAWTTGPLLAMSGQRPLSEDLLKYTPKGGRSEVPVAAAVNIAHDRSESELDRKFKAHSPADDTFLDLVTLGGELKLKNFERSDVELVVSVAVPGKPTEASAGGQMAADPTHLQLLERAGTLRWTVSLKPDEGKVLTYKYDRYVPSR